VTEKFSCSFDSRPDR